MMYLRYVAYLPFNLLFVLLAFMLSPFLAALSMLTGPLLPGCLQYFSTLDDTLDGGQHQHPELYAPGAKRITLWWQRTCWICRNPAHGWQCKILGFPTAGHSVVFQRQKFEGDATTPGTHFVIITKMTDAKGRNYFSYRADKKLPFGLSAKIWFGWNPAAYDGVSHNYEFQPFMIHR
jgi:hypothetical protein